MPMKPSDWGLNMFDARTMRAIKLAEGLRLEAYKDPLGFWTIGYGHFLDQNRDWDGHKISQEEADRLFLQDFSDAKNRALTLPEACGLSGTRFNCLLELVFNMGLAKWKGFVKCRAAIPKQEWETVKKELLDSRWASQVGPLRANRIADQFVTNEYAEEPDHGNSIQKA